MINSAQLLDAFRRDRARGTNDDIALSLRPAFMDLLAKLGNPHTKLPLVFHVAGTNGKGSTCAYLRAIFEAAGKSVHVYTSPHLVRFHERIRIAGQLIEEAELVELLQACHDLAEPGGVTYFEAATAAAFAAFARHPADYTILEVGLGGRLDATNVIPTSLAAIITRLSSDHRDYLGDTMQSIAREKAGIMRAHIPCFAAAQPDRDAMQTLQSEASRIGVKLSMAGKDWHIEKTASGCHYTDQFGALDLPLPALPGMHQIDNAGLAIAALRGVTDVQSEHIARGLQGVEWPARLQQLTSGTLAKILPQGSELWLDGGHNDSAGEVLAQQAAEWRKQDALPLHLVIGMLTTKHPDEFLRPLHPAIDGVQTVAIENEIASYTANDLADYIRGVGFQNVVAANDVKAAVKKLIADGNPKRILICGSLYLAGQVLRMNG